MTARVREESIGALDFDEAISITDAPERCEDWRATFASSAEWVTLDDVAVPRDEALAALCRDWGFPAVAITQLLEHRAEWDDARIRRLGAHVQWMIARGKMPAGNRPTGWPPVFSRAPLFYAYAALGLARRVAAQQAALAIDPEITRATVRDLGQQIHLHHRVHGGTGMNKGWWLFHHLGHRLFRIGRLQFLRARARKGLGPIEPEECFLDVHIPEDGALDATACDASFDRSRAFFEAHFSDERARHFACSSWLLDPVLEELLPAEANILRFGRRFDLDHLRDGPSGVFEFVFDRPDLDGVVAPDIAGLPRDTRLRAAIAEHYDRGGAIRMGVGTIQP